MSSFTIWATVQLFINVVWEAVMIGGDLLQALKSGHLGGTALDVFDPEPTPPSNPMLRLPNIVLSLGCLQ